jgi:hypothetical protein
MSEMTLLLKFSQHAARKELRQKTHRFPFTQSIRVREKRLNVVWKSYESGPFHCKATLAGSAGVTLASKRKNLCGRYAK